MAEYLSKPVMLNVTGQEIRDKIGTLVTDVTGQEIKVELTNINSSILKLAGEQVDLIHEVYQNYVPTSYTKEGWKVANISAPTLDEYTTFKTDTETELTEHEDRLDDVETVAAAASAQAAQNHTDIHNIEYDSWVPEANKPWIYASSSGTANKLILKGSVGGGSDIEPFLRDCVNFNLVLKDQDISSNTTVVGIKSDIISIESDVAANTASINTMVLSTIPTMQTNISSNKADIDTLKTTVDRLDFTADDSLKFTVDATTGDRILGVNAVDKGGLNISSSGVAVDGFTVLTTMPTAPNMGPAQKVVILDKSYDDPTLYPRQYGYLYIYLE